MTVTLVAESEHGAAGLGCWCDPRYLIACDECGNAEQLKDVARSHGAHFVHSFPDHLRCPSVPELLEVHARAGGVAAARRGSLRRDDHRGAQPMTHDQGRDVGASREPGIPGRSGPTSSPYGGFAPCHRR
jgi:hypothetical protein